MSSDGNQFVQDIVDGLEEIRRYVRGECELRVTTLTAEGHAAYLAALSSGKVGKARRVKRIRRRRS